MYVCMYVYVCRFMCVAAAARRSGSPEGFALPCAAQGDAGLCRCRFAGGRRKCALRGTRG